MLSIFCIILGLGNLLSNYITGILLDKFQPGSTWLGYKDANSAFIIPPLLLALNIFSCLVVLISLAIYLLSKDSFNIKTKNENSN